MDNIFGPSTVNAKATVGGVVRSPKASGYAEPHLRNGTQGVLSWRCASVQVGATRLDS